MKIAAISAKMQKIEDASRKKDEQTNQFILATREALEQKMEQHGSNREAYITDLKTKLKVKLPEHTLIFQLKCLVTSSCSCLLNT